MLKQKKIKKCFNGFEWDPKMTMGKVNWFGWSICCSLDNSMTGLVGRVFA
jgi:hypothetical protein